MQELEHHEQLYAGPAQALFAKPAVRAFRRHLVKRLVRLLRLTPASRVLSIGCGIGDTELVLAPHVAEVTGIDLSPAGIAQARADALTAGIRNARFVVGSVPGAELRGEFHAVIAIFFLHHLGQNELRAMPGVLKTLLRAGGSFYGLDPSRYRLSGAVGKILVPWLMRKYQTEGEQPVDRRALHRIFSRDGFDCQTGLYDFTSTPLAGLFPGWETGYRAARVLDGGLIRCPGIRELGSNVEVVARHINSSNALQCSS